MRVGPVVVLLIGVMGMSLCAGVVFGQTCSIEISPIDAKGNPLPPVFLRAQTIIGSAPVISASGNVVFQNCKRTATASEISYNTKLLTGSLKNVVFTTCDKASPDYRFTARELRMLPNGRLQARKASLFIGRFKVFTLPYFKINAARGGVATDAFPRPAYDKDNGFGIAQKIRMVDSDRLIATADLRLTTKRGLEGEIDNTWGVDGKLLELPGKFLTYDSLRSSALTIPRVFPNIGCGPEDLRPTGEARIRQFSRFSLRQWIYNTKNTGLLVYRQPEVGVRYIADQLNLGHTELDPRLEMYPEFVVSWGRYKEDPGTVGLTDRTSFSAALPVNFIPLGRTMAVQPIFNYSTATYGGGDAYKTSGYGIDISKLYQNGSMVSARYIARNQSGQSPFLFDTIDIFHEFQGACQLRFGQHIAGFVVGYDADTGRTYDWELLYGYHTDCLAGWVTYDSRLQRFMFDAALINM